MNSGHFSSYYYNSVPELFQGYSVDVCEVQSQGLEMLANQYAVDMFGEGAEAFEFESVTDMLYVTIMSCMLQEFEEAVYMEPDMSLEDMNRTFKEIQDSYHGWYYDVYDEGVCYDWVDVSHLFYSPCIIWDTEPRRCRPLTSGPYPGATGTALWIPTWDFCMKVWMLLTAAPCTAAGFGMCLTAGNWNPGRGCAGSRDWSRMVRALKSRHRRTRAGQERILRDGLTVD
ncbi:MAG: hypothetical protein ACLR0U_26285 [Enterocloster clostridioformis]